MSYSIREMRKEEYSLLSDFLYEAIYIPDGTRCWNLVMTYFPRIASIHCKFWKQQTR